MGFREALVPPAGFGLVAEARGALLGYLIGRRLGDDGEILNLAVLPSARRRGVATALLEAALEQLRLAGVTAVFLEVRESNRGAQALYLRRGFRVIGGRPGYYRNPPENALVLRLALAPSA